MVPLLIQIEGGALLNFGLSVLSFPSAHQGLKALPAEHTGMWHRQQVGDFWDCWEFSELTVHRFF